MEELKCTPRECLDIYVKRILSKFTLRNEQIFYCQGGVAAAQQPKGYGKSPVEICILNIAPPPCNGVHTEVKNETGYTAQCIEDVRVVFPTPTCRSISQQIICNSKSRIVLKFKIVLLVRYSNGSFDVVTLPDDEGSKFCFVNPGCFGQTIGLDGRTETLEWDQEDKVFVLTIDIPLCKFDHKLPKEVFNDPTLQSEVVIKNIRSDFDVFGDCTCYQGHPGTLVELSVFADITDKIGVDQDILVEGTPIDC